MAEKKFQVTEDGQAILQEDFNLLGEGAGLADDRVFAELLKITPYDGSTVTTGILPNGTGAALIGTNGASGSVLVQPFRAFVGSRTAVASGAKANLRDIRSGLSVAAGDTTLTKTVSLAANGTANPRWDAVYAVVSIDTDDASVVRKVKSPTTGVVADTSVVVTKSTTVTVGVTAGTAAASPVFPSLPSNTSDTFYIALGYVRVPAGFNSTATVAASDIATTANCLTLSPSTGAVTSRFASTHRTITTAEQQSWGSTGTRPSKIVASTATGSETTWVLVRMGASPNFAHGDTVDSRDWRKRFVVATVSQDGTGKTPSWGVSASTTTAAPSSEQIFGVPGTLNEVRTSMSHTMATSHVWFISEDTNPVGAPIAVLFFDVGDTEYRTVLYVDMTDGKLKYYNPTGLNDDYTFIVKLDWSPALDNTGG